MLLDPHHISWWTRKSHWCNRFSKFSLETSNIPGHKTSLRIVPIHYHAFNSELMNMIQFQQAQHNHTQDPSNDGVFQLDCTWRLSVWVYEVGKKIPGFLRTRDTSTKGAETNTFHYHLSSPEINKCNYMGVSKNRGTPKWMVDNRKPY